MTKLIVLKTFLSEIRSRIWLSHDEALFIKAFRSLKSERPADASRPPLNIVMQMTEDYSLVALFTVITKILKQRFNLKIHWVNPYCGFHRTGRGALIRQSSFFDRKWSKLYTSNGGDISLVNLFYEESLDAELTAKGEKIFLGLESKDALVALNVDGIIIGDLVYDTYLRFRPAATVDLKDELLRTILVTALHIQKASKEFLMASGCTHIFTSYTSYIQHGVLVRVGLAQGCKVISFGSYDQLAKSVSQEFPTHAKDYTHYKAIFDALPVDQKEEFREKSRLKLESRFKGVVDPSIFYMKESAFGPSSEERKPALRKSDKKKAIVFLHCFFDSPHIYRYMLYPDFLHWIQRTLEIASETDFDFYVKPHPNGLAGNQEIVEKLVQSFPKITFLSSGISNSHLIEEGFDVAFTVYGTLGHEYTYFGIPVVNAGDNPHANYSFCIHAESREKYEWYIRNIDKIPAVSESAKMDILEFYFMHNDYLFPGKLPQKECDFINKEIRSINSPAALGDFAGKMASPDYQEKIFECVGMSLDAVL